MANIAPEPFVLKDYLLTIGDDQYQKGVDQVEIVPTLNIQTWRGGTPDAIYSDVTVTGWNYTIRFPQDWETTDSLSLLAHASDGGQVEIIFKPKSGSGPTVEVTIVLVPGSIGGQNGAWAMSTLSGPCVGKPAVVPAA